MLAALTLKLFSPEIEPYPTALLADIAVQPERTPTKRRLSSDKPSELSEECRGRSAAKDVLITVLVAGALVGLAVFC